MHAWLISRDKEGIKISQQLSTKREFGTYELRLQLPAQFDNKSNFQTPNV
jgi:hypothetical protein